MFARDPPRAAFLRGEETGESWPPNADADSLVFSETRGQTESGTMQKALIVRTSVDAGKEGVFSYEVDPVGASPANPLRRLLAAGWEVVHVCPMTNDLESACLVILDRPAPGQPRPAARKDLSLVDMNHPSPWMSVPGRADKSRAAMDDWDGETIPLGIFRVDPAHAETNPSDAREPSPTLPPSR
jgi:hypothetical protein